MQIFESACFIYNYFDVKQDLRSRSNYEALPSYERTTNKSSGPVCVCLIRPYKAWLVRDAGDFNGNRQCNRDCVSFNFDLILFFMYS